MTDHSERLLKQHLDLLEQILILRARSAGLAGSPVNVGSPREEFVREFLSLHLGETFAIGQGEVVDSASNVGDRRPQIDIVIFNRKYPRIPIGGGVSAFFAESVLACIEIKSKLTKKEVKLAVQAASKIKALQVNRVGDEPPGYPPSILCYLVGYDGPAKMQTVHRWVDDAQAAIGLTEPMLPTTHNERILVASPSLDAVVQLGCGVLQFDNSPMSYTTDANRSRVLEGNWHALNDPQGNLLHLFMKLVLASSNFSAATLNPEPYMRGIRRETNVIHPSKCKTPRRGDV